jgi:hypothetical protein
VPSQTADTIDQLLAELRELTRDVDGGELARARRLAVLRRLERRMADGDRPRGLAIA